MSILVADGLESGRPRKRPVVIGSAGDIFSQLHMLCRNRTIEKHLGILEKAVLPNGWNGKSYSNG